MRDFFYYSMIRSKDENTTRTRKLDGTVPLVELPNLMRAMGHYPNNQEIEDMTNEVRFSNFAETGQYVEAFDLDTFIKLFVNHRPVYGIGKPHIEDAFKEFGDKTMPTADLLTKLQKEGNMMNLEELQQCLFTLTGEQDFRNALPDTYISAEDYAQTVLGFEEIEDDEEIGEGEEEEENDEP
jgi:Ca2+-binding EF-hand superfamily protein